MSEPIPNGNQTINQTPKAKSRFVRRLLPFGVILAIAIGLLVTKQSTPSEIKEDFPVSGNEKLNTISTTGQIISGENSNTNTGSIENKPSTNIANVQNTGKTIEKQEKNDTSNKKTKTISGSTKLAAFYETKQISNNKTQINIKNDSIILVATGKVKGKLTIQDVDSIIASTKEWDTEISAPVLITKGDGLAKIGEPGLVNIKRVLQTIKVGSNTTELLVNTGSYFLVSFQVSGGKAGENLKIFRSQDGKLRAQNSPDKACILDNDRYCNFRTDHLTYFTVGSPSSISGNFVINNDQEITTGLSVTLNMSVSGATLMKFGNTTGERDSADWTGYSDTYSFTLSGSNRGTKTVYAAFANGTDTGYVPDSIIFNWDNDNFLDDRFRALNPTTGQIIWALYGDGSGGVDRTAYTKLRTAQSCITGLVNVQYINSGLNQIPQNLSGNTIYVLEKGNHITARNQQLSGSCIAVVGANAPILYSSGKINYMFYWTGAAKKFNIIDGIKIDGMNNGGGGTHTNNDNGIFVGDINSLPTYNTFNNIKSYLNVVGIMNQSQSYLYNIETFNNTNNGIQSRGRGSHIVMENIYSYNNGGAGIRYQDGAAGGAYFNGNNINLFNNGGGGFYGGGAPTYATFNNTRIYNNNGYGIYLGVATVLNVNNAEIYNNQVGIYSVSAINANINNIKMFNNVVGIQNINMKLYGNNHIFDNAILSIGGSIVTLGYLSQAKRDTGAIFTTTKFNGCESASNATNTGGLYINDLNQLCDRVGKNTSRNANSTTYNTYTKESLKQNQPIEYRGSIVLSNNFVYNTGKYIAEINRVPYSSIKFEPDSGYTTGTSIQLKLQTTDPVNYTITGDIQEGTINGTISDSGIISATLTNGNGVKYIYAVFSTGSFTQQQVFIKIKLTDQATMNTEKAFISGYFSSGTEYTKYRSLNQCNTDKMLIQELNPGTGTISQNNLEINTLYILNSGSYIQTGQINLNGSCIGLVGSGKVNLTSSGTVARLINMTAIKNNIVSNLKLDGKNTSTNGINMGSYSTNMTITNMEIQKTSVGILLSPGVYFHTLSKNKIFNITSQGILIDGWFHKILNSDIFNIIGGIGLQFQPNSPGYITVNNIKIFNCQRGIRGGNANNSTFNNIQIFNITIGALGNFSLNYLFNNSNFYNSQVGFGGSRGANTNNMNIYNNINGMDTSIYTGYGTIRVFNNINNFNGGTMKASATNHASLPRTSGTLYTGNIRMSCDRATTAVYSGQYFFDINGDCGDILTKTRTVNDGNSQYLYGSNIQKQTQPVYYNMYGQLLTGDFGYDPSKFIGEREDRLPFGVAHFIPNSGATGNPNTQIELVVSDPMDFIISGDIQDIITGTVSDSGIYNISLTNFTGMKNIYVTFSTGSWTEPTLIKTIELTQNPRDDLVDQYFCANSRYNDRRSFNQCCFGGMKVQILEPGKGTIPQTLKSDTIYILNSGDYISTGMIAFGGDCTALVGSGEVTLYSTGQLVNFIYGNGRENIILENLKIDGTGTTLSGGAVHIANTNAISMVGVYDNSAINNVQSYNNGIGYYNASSYYTLVNNSDFYNNSSYGIQFAGGVGATINNSKAFNNANGIYFNNGSGSITNSVISNNNVGIINYGANFYDNSLLANNATTFSNASGIPLLSRLKFLKNFNASIAGTKYYNTITFQNNIVTATNGTTGGLEYSGIGRTSGNINISTIPFNIKDILTPQNTSGTQLQNINSTYDTIGYIATNPRNKIKTIGIGSSLFNQAYPIYINTTGILVTGNFQTNTEKYIAETSTSVAQGTINFEPDEGYTSSNSVNIKAKVSYPMSVTITGDFLESPVSFTVNTEITTGIILTASTGIKYIYATFSTGGYTQSMIRDKIKYVDSTTKINEQNFILDRFSSGSYTENWSFNGCDTADMTVETVNPGIGTLSQNGLEKNTVYLLNSGAYITTGQINFNGSCIGLIGSGDVRLYSTTNLGNMIYLENRRSIIVENLKVDGYNNGTGGVHATKNTNGIKITSYGANSTLNKIQSFLNTTNGVFIGSYNVGYTAFTTVINSQFFSNTYGLQLDIYNTNSYINNIESFNNNIGLYLYGSNYNNINNSKFHNNTNEGISFDGRPNLLSIANYNTLKNSSTYNNGIGINFLAINGTIRNKGSNNRLSNVKIFNNTTGIYSYLTTGNRYYDQLTLFGNGINITGDSTSVFTSGSSLEYPGLGRTTGEILYPAYTMSCDRFSNPINQLSNLGYITSGVFLSNPLGLCNTKGALSRTGPIMNTYYSDNTMLQTQPVRYNTTNTLVLSPYNYNTGQYIAEYNLLPDFAVYDVTGSTLGDVTASLTKINLSRFSILNNSGATGYTFSQNGIFDWIYFDNVLNVTGTIRAQVTWIDNAVPNLIFTGQTPDNNLIKTGNTFTGSVDIAEDRLKKYTWNRNGTTLIGTIPDYFESIYYPQEQTAKLSMTDYSDPSLILAVNLDNQTTAGETTTIVKDFSYLNNTGTITSAPWTSSGKFDGALNFVADTSIVSFADNTLYTLSGNFTLSAWINPDDVANDYKAIIGTYNTNGFDFGLDNTNENKLYYRSANVTLLSGGTASAIAEDGTRKHVIFTKSGTVGTFYINGNLVASGTAVAGTDGGALHIGGRGTSQTTTRFDGLIDDVRVYNRALSSGEIRQSYANSISLYTGGKWQFDTSMSGLANGSYNYQTCAEDGRGWTGCTEQRIITVDNSVPAVANMSPVSGSQLKTGTVNIIWSGSDNIGISGFLYEISTGSNFANILYSGITTDTGITITGLEDKTYYRHTRAFDTASNYSNFTSGWSFYIDTINPSIQLLSPVSGAMITTGTVNLLRSGSDNIGISGYIYQIATGSNFSNTLYSGNTINTGITLSGFTDGTYYRRAKALDNAGNESIYTSTRPFNIDFNAPTVELLSPSDGYGYNGSNISLLWSGNDGSGAGISGYNYQIAYDTGFTSLVKNGTTTNTGYATKLSNGTYYRHIRGYDKAGNYAVYTPYQSFSVSSGSSDIDDPTIETISPTHLSYFETGSLSLVRSGNDGTGSGISGYIYQVASDSNFSSIVKSGWRTTTGVSVVGLTNGTYYRHVKAVDNTNNESFFTDAISFKIFDIEAFLLASSYTKIATNIFAGSGAIDINILHDGFGVSKTTKQLVMRDTGALPIEVIIPRNTYFKNDSLEDYTGVLNNPSYIDTGTINGFDASTIIQAISIGDETQSVSFTNQSGADVNAIIKIPTPGHIVGEEASIYYSNNNSNWIKHVDTTVRLINNEPYVQFYSPHFTDFIVTYASGQVVGCDGGGANGESCVVLSVSAGNILYGAPLSGLDFGAISSSNIIQELSGRFDGTGIYENFFRVQDLKGEDLGWYTTVESTALLGQGVTSGFSIPSSNIQIASDTGATFFEGIPNDTYVGIDNNYTPLDDIVTYLQRDEAPNFLKANLYGHQPRIKISIPAFSKPGQYHGQIVLTMYDRS